MRCEPERWRKYLIPNPEKVLGGGGTGPPVMDEPHEEEPPPT